MVLIIGGAYQGKLDFAREQLGITDGDVFVCNGAEIDFSKRCICGLEKFAYACTQAGTKPGEYLKAHREQWQDSIFICRDIFCGVVPMGAENRAWRQATGRLVQYLGREAARVSRIFCGLEERLK